MIESNEVTKCPWKAEVGDVIIRHPDHPETTGEWTVIGEPKTANTITTIPYSMDDGGEGVFALEVAQRIIVRASRTYILAALLTPAERETALRAMNTRERLHIAETVADRFPEVFDAAVSLLGKANLHQTATEATQS